MQFFVNQMVAIIFEFIGLQIAATENIIIIMTGLKVIDKEYWKAFQLI